MLMGMQGDACICRSMWIWGPTCGASFIFKAPVLLEKFQALSLLFLRGRSVFEFLTSQKLATVHCHFNQDVSACRQIVKRGYCASQSHSFSCISFMWDCINQKITVYGMSMLFISVGQTIKKKFDLELLLLLLSFVTERDAEALSSNI